MRRYEKIQEVYKYNKVEANGASEEAIARFEEHIGESLPPEFRAYLAAFDGADFGNTGIDTSDGIGVHQVDPPGIVGLDCILRVGSPPSDYRSLWHERVGEERIFRQDGDTYLCIGWDNDGHQLYLALSGDWEDCIWLSVGDNDFPIATSINDFFMKVKIDPSKDGGAG